MSLLVHFPFKNDIKNYGILPNSDFISTGVLTNKALSSGNLKITASGAAKTFNNEEISISFWIYPNVDTGGSGGIIFGTEGMTAPNNRKFSIFQYPTANDLHWSWQNDTNTTFTSGAKYGVLPSYTWTHICITYRNSVATVYINGAQIGTSSGTSNSSSFAYETIIARASSTRYLRDLRIYNNCLNAREIQILSQNLVLHYSMNDPYPTRAINLYSDETFCGECSSSGFTVTKLSDEIGYNYALSYTGTGSNTWRNISFPAITSFTAGKKYMFSCAIRKNSGNTGQISIRAARISNDWEATQKSVLTASDNEWHTYSVIAEMPASYTRSGTTYTVQPRVEFYTPNLNTNGTIYNYNFDLKDIVISECDDGAPITNGSWLNEKIYDLSNNQSHGFISFASAPSLAINSPVNNYCYQFNGAQQIQKINNPITLETTSFSLSFWVNFTATTTQTLYTARTAVGKGLALFAINSKFRFDDGGLQTTFNYTIPTNTWIYVVVIHTPTNKKLYINGELKQSTSSSGSLSNIGTYGTIGASEASDNGIGIDNWLKGYLSDFRIYASELTQEEISNAFITLTDSGSLLTKGEFIE